MNRLCGILLSKSYNKNFRVDHYCSSQPWFSDFEALLECFAGYFFVFVEGVGVDVQCGGGLGVAQEAGYRSYCRWQSGGWHCCVGGYARLTSPADRSS